MKYFYSDSNGHIQVNPTASQLAPNNLYEEYLSRIDIINKLIDIGIYSYSNDTGLKSNALDCIKNPSKMKTSNGETKQSPGLVHNDNTVLSLSKYPDLYLGGLVSENFSELKDVYKSSLFYKDAVAYWIDKVKSRGDWDYKSLDGFKGQKFMCTYGQNDRFTDLRTSEWIGNYNYGYTGHLLFSIDILIAGSTAVGGGPAKDSHDWPAIKGGYYDSGSIEW